MHVHIHKTGKYNLAADINNSTLRRFQTPNFLYNTAFYQSLMRQMRDAITAGTFDEWRRAFEAGPASREMKEDE